MGYKNWIAICPRCDKKHRVRDYNETCSNCNAPLELMECYGYYMYTIECIKCGRERRVYEIRCSCGAIIPSNPKWIRPIYSKPLGVFVSALQFGFLGFLILGVSGCVVRMTTGDSQISVIARAFSNEGIAAAVIGIIIGTLWGIYKDVRIS